MIPGEEDSSNNKLRNEAPSTGRKKCIQWDEENIRQTELERPIRLQGVAKASDEPKTPYVKWVESESDEPSPMQLSQECIVATSCTSTGGGTTDEEDFIQRRREHYKLSHKENKEAEE